ncbi:AAA family ATPase [Agrobacterium deltaense]|uniref:AAA family ATPase n=1 Tax=Agrobacterium deltaense TaxID=1183412 RepID=UPI003D97EDFE
MGILTAEADGSLLMAVVVCFSGKIGSGKSSVISELSRSLRWKQAGFGQFVRQEIVRRGDDPHSREALQDFGQRSVEADPEAFCHGLLKSANYRPGEDLLVDGVRHVKIFETLQAIISPASVRLVHLSLTDDAQQVRVDRRTDSADLNRARGHAVEAELISDLPQRADLIVNADVPFEQVIQECLLAIRRWRA